MAGAAAMGTEVTHSSPETSGWALANGRAPNLTAAGGSVDGTPPAA
jgi:hypothetical protein